MRLIIIPLTLLLALGCTKRPAELSDKCKQIIESDSFYYAVPIVEMEAQFDPMYKLDNFLTTSTDSGIETIDFDCLVLVNPTKEQLEELRKILETDFDETLSINYTHSEAAKCIAESKGIRSIDATERFIRFTTTNQTWDLDLQKGKFPEWKFILFKKGKNPEVIPNTRLTLDKIDQYFETGR